MTHRLMKPARVRWSFEWQMWVEPVQTDVRMIWMGASTSARGMAIVLETKTRYAYIANRLFDFLVHLLGNHSWKTAGPKANGALNWGAEQQVQALRRYTRNVHREYFSPETVCWKNHYVRKYKIKIKLIRTGKHPRLTGKTQTLHIHKRFISAHIFPVMGCHVHQMRRSYVCCSCSSGNWGAVLTFRNSGGK